MNLNQTISFADLISNLQNAIVIRLDQKEFSAKMENVLAKKDMKETNVKNAFQTTMVLIAKVSMIMIYNTIFR